MISIEYSNFSQSIFIVFLIETTPFLHDIKGKQGILHWFSLFQDNHCAGIHFGVGFFKLQISIQVIVKYS